MIYWNVKPANGELAIIFLNPVPIWNLECAKMQMDPSSITLHATVFAKIEYAWNTNRQQFD